MGDIKRICQDDREIQSLAKDWFLVEVGINGITKIVPYQEYGQMAEVTWFAIYKDNFLYSRIDSAGLYVIYKQ